MAVLIPARNEAEGLAATLDGLARQGPGLEVLVVDDQSEDATADVARAEAARLLRPAAGRFPLRVRLVRGKALPEGWGGKLWALEQGLAAVDRPVTLLLDADIVLDAGVLPGLLALARRRGAALVSVMATLRCERFWERLLAPAFVYFFKLLYPFALVNDSRRTAAAAAGGCVLAETQVLREAGAFAAIRSALIDDCSLAALVKRRGHGLWLGLSRSVRSRRAYPRLADFRRMVRRTAFTQLGYSAPLLALTVAAMLALFAAPVLALAALVSPALGLSAAASPGAALLGAAALAAMAASYAPTVRFYRLSPLWVLALPLAAMLFAAMTVESAASYWRGTRAEWKNRTYGVLDD